MIIVLSRERYPLQVYYNNFNFARVIVRSFV